MENVELLPGIHTELLGEQELHLNMCVCWATDTLRFICYSSKHYLTNTKALTLLPNLWVAFSSSAKWSEEYIHHKAAVRLDYMSHSVMDRVYHVPQGHGHMWTHQIHRAPGSFKLAATVTVTFLYQVQPTWFQLTLGLKQPIQSALFIEGNKWAQFLLHSGSAISKAMAGLVFCTCSVPRSNALADGIPLPSGPTLRIRERGWFFF